MSKADEKAAGQSPPGAPGAQGAPKRPRSRARRLFLITFKWCRIAVLLLVFVVLVLGLFLNHVGLPDWVESRLREQLKEQGWEVNYSRLRLRWYHGVVADDLQLRRTDATAGPHLFLRRAEFRPNWRSLLDFRIESEGVALEEGRLVWPLPGTNLPQRTFVLNQLGGNTEVRISEMENVTDAAFEELRWLERVENWLTRQRPF